MRVRWGLGSIWYSGSDSHFDPKGFESLTLREETWLKRMTKKVLNVLTFTRKTAFSNIKYNYILLLFKR